MELLNKPLDKKVVCLNDHNVQPVSVRTGDTEAPAGESGVVKRAPMAGAMQTFWMSISAVVPHKLRTEQKREMMTPLKVRSK
jgi:predicted secreted protein